MMKTDKLYSTNCSNDEGNESKQIMVTEFNLHHLFGGRATVEQADCEPGPPMVSEYGRLAGQWGQVFLVSFDCRHRGMYEPSALGVISV